MLAALLLLAVAAGGCLGAPEQCRGCAHLDSDAGGAVDRGGGDRGAFDAGDDVGADAPSIGGTGGGGSGGGGSGGGGGGADGGGAVDLGSGTPDGPADMPLPDAGRDAGAPDVPPDLPPDTGPDAAPDSGGPPPDLIAYYAFDQSSGTTATDSSGNGRNGTLVGGATFVPGMVRNALALNGSTGYLDLPDGLFQNVSAFTVAVWVRVRADANWARIFDFGASSSASLFLTTHAQVTNAPRFAITTSGNAGEQRLDGTGLLPLNSWKHVVVAVGAGTGALYVDGARVTTGAITLRPSDLGATVNNWVGRSQYAVDPFLTGDVDELRIYNRALTAAEVTALFAQR